jgi:hypothetical protein
MSRALYRCNALLDRDRRVGSVSMAGSVIRVILPQHLRTLAGVGAEVHLRKLL